MGNHTDKHMATRDGLRTQRTKGSGKHFRSGQTRIQADRTRSNGNHAPHGAGHAQHGAAQATSRAQGTRDVRPARLPSEPRGTHPERSRRARAVPTKPQGDVDDGTLAKLLAASGRHLAVSATDGVRKNTTPGGRSDGPSARTNPGEPPRVRRLHRKHRWFRRVRARTPRRTSKEGRIPTRNTSESRGNSGREREDRCTARSGSHQTTSMGPTRTRKERERGATEAQGAPEARSNREERHEDDLEGEQGPGRDGHRTPEYGARRSETTHGAKPRGTTSHGYGNSGETGNGDVGTAEDS